MDSVFLFLISSAIIFLAYYLPYDYGKYEGVGDAIKIAAAGGKDTRKHQRQFHLLNIVERFAAAVCLISLATVGMNIAAGFTYWFGLVYAFYFPGAFGYRFTTVLNKNRGLDTWYVSRSPKAARFDRNMIKFARLFRTPPENLNCMVHSFYFRFSAVALFFWILIETFRPEWILPIK